MIKATEILETIKDAILTTDSSLYGRTGKFIKIVIPTNPADGCKWIPKYDSSYLTLISKNLFKDVGTSWTGKDIFVFRAEKEGTTKVIMRSSPDGDSKSYWIEIYNTENTDQIKRLEKCLL